MSEKKRVIVLDDLAPEGIERLRGEGLAVERRRLGRGGAAAPASTGYHAPRSPARARRSPPPSWRRARALKVVGRAGVDVGGIDVAEATRRGIVVVHAPDAGLVSEAEHALALVLACARDLSGADAALRAGGCGDAASRRRRRGARQDARPGRASARAPACWPSAPARSA